jgi:hypothetical protein
MRGTAPSGVRRKLPDAKFTSAVYDSGSDAKTSSHRNRRSRLSVVTTVAISQKNAIAFKK